MTELNKTRNSIENINMENQNKSDCCNGCQNGKPGGNPTCQVKLMVEKMKKMDVQQVLKNKN